MARFDVYRTDTGYAVDVQTDLLDGLTTRLMVPLLDPAVAPKAIGRLNPTLEIDGKPYRMMTQYMTATRANQLGRAVANLDDHYDQITSAVSMILNGF
jgi:toxin CcdB